MEAAKRHGGAFGSLASPPKLSDPFLVGGLEHGFYFPFHIWDVILPIDFHIFQRGRYTTNQILIGVFIRDRPAIGYPIVKEPKYLTHSKNSLLMVSYMDLYGIWLCTSKVKYCILSYCTDIIIYNILFIYIYIYLYIFRVHKDLIQA